jgi:hypothetical protein
MQTVLKNYFFIILASFLMFACASTGPELVAQKMEKADKAEKKAVDTQTNDIPKWFLDVPDGEGVMGYHRGTGTSTMLQMAIDIATMEAQEDLADALNAKVSSQTKKFVSQSGLGMDSEVAGEFEQVTKKVVAESSVAGWSIKETDVQSINGNFIAYVLLEYIYGPENKLLQQKIKQDNKLLTAVKATEAYAELEEEIKKAAE